MQETARVMFKADASVSAAVSEGEALQRELIEGEKTFMTKFQDIGHKVVLPLCMHSNY